MGASIECQCGQGKTIGDLQRPSTWREIRKAMTWSRNHAVKIAGTEPKKRIGRHEYMIFRVGKGTKGEFKSYGGRQDMVSATNVVIDPKRRTFWVKA